METAFELWPHQREAIDLIVKQLGDGGRCQAVLACGTGKTRIGMHAAQRLAPGGRVLVVVPTVLLLAQTLRAYRDEFTDGPLGRLLAVCGDAQVSEGGRAAREELAAQSVEVTTDPSRIADVVAGSGRVTVMTTYASLPALRRAHRDHAAPAWDVVIADEAHRSAGGGLWSRVHDDAALPAVRRLSMTATPRIAGARDTAVGMDEESVYGPVVYRLGLPTAIEVGLLASWRLVVPVISSEEVRRLVAADEADSLVQVGGAAVPARMLAAQIALLRGAREFDLNAAITYHSGVAAARAFAATLPEAARLLPEAERPVLRWSGDVHGGHSAFQRDLRLRHLADAADGLAVVSNARLLAEGVDLPAVDAVTFCDAKNSVVDVVQAIGRALRLGGRPGKIATIVVPLLADHDDAQQLAGDEHAALRQVIQALKAHDDGLAADISQRARDRYRHPDATAQGGEGGDVWRPHWLEVTGRGLPTGFVEAVGLRLVEAATTNWERSYAAVAAYHERHGHIRIPSTYRCSDGFRPQQWLSNQIAKRRRGELTGQQVALLDALGIDWVPNPWQRFLRHATAHAAVHGDLDVPLTYVTADGYALGHHLHVKRNQRRKRRLSREQIAALDALGMVWDSFDKAWDDWFALAEEFHNQHGHLRVPDDYQTADGRALGNWIGMQRRLHNKKRLSEDRYQRLVAIGMIFSPREWMWRRAFDALADFYHRHNHLRVPSDLRTEDGVRLRSWWLRQRRKFHSLTPERQALLLRLDPALGQPATQPHPAAPEEPSDSAA